MAERRWSLLVSQGEPLLVLESLRSPWAGGGCPASVDGAMRGLSRFWFSFFMTMGVKRTLRVTTSPLSSSWQLCERGMAGILSPSHRWANGGSEKWREVLLLSHYFGIYFNSHPYASRQIPRISARIWEPSNGGARPLLQKGNVPIYFWFDIP